MFCSAFRHSPRKQRRQGLALAVAMVTWFASLGSRTLPTVQAATQVSVSTYRAQLQRAESALRPDAPRVGASAALTPLTTSQNVQRADGKTLPTDNGEWSRRVKEFANPPTGNQVAGARQAVLARLRALDEWSRQDFVPADAQGADAQSIMHQLESSGQIRTGPTWWQQLQATVLKAIGNLLKRIFGGVGAVIPTGTATVAYWILGILGIACLLLVCWLIVRAFLNRTGHGRGRKRGIEALGEDADLLIYGPDELRSRARRFAAQGNFREALRHLYVALLLELDAKGAWRYDPRRTNWEHIAQLRNAPRSDTQALAPPMAELTQRFDRVRYGNAPCEEPDWSRFAQDAERIQQQLIAKAGGAA